MESKLFKTIDQDNHQLIVDTHYYKWLVEQDKKDIHLSNTKKEYLTSQGFNWGVDKISVEDHIRLRAIEVNYFDLVVKPTLRV